MQNKKFTFLMIPIFCIFNWMSLAYQTERSFQAGQIPEELKGIQIDEKLGSFIDLNLTFKNENGQTTSLNNYFNQTNHPVLLTIIYYRCPNLCQLHLNGVSQAINQLQKEKKEFENQFQFVAVSMDPKETPPLAKAKKDNYVKTMENITGNNWHFLTGSEKNIKALSDQVGFRFQWNEKQKQFAHLPVAYVLTPKGRISRYLYGVEIEEKTLKLSLVEASQGRIGGLVERILLFCFQFDPRKNQYTLYAYNLMRVAGGLTILLLALLLIPRWISKKKGSV